MWHGSVVLTLFLKENASAGKIHSSHRREPEKEEPEQAVAEVEAAATSATIEA